MAVTPSASYSLTVRVEIRNRPGMLGRVTSAIGDAGGDIGAVDIVELLRDRNQINNVLCFPGFFRGLLDCRAMRVTDEMKIAAAQAIASIVGRSELHQAYVIPSVFDKKVAPAVAREVIKAAHKGGVARRRKPSAHH